MGGESIVIPVRTIACDGCGTVGAVGYSYSYAGGGEATTLLVEPQVQQALSAETTQLSRGGGGGHIQIPAQIPVHGGWTLPKGFSVVILCEDCKALTITDRRN